MQKIFLNGLMLTVAMAILSCSRPVAGELTGVGGRGNWVETPPYGMSFVGQGSFNIGPNDQEAETDGTPTKTVSVDAFWIDNTEITNNEYRQFIQWTRDKIARQLLASNFPEFEIREDRKGNPVDPPQINWKEKIRWEDPEYLNALNELFVSDVERFNGKREIDPRKLVYEYWWIDYKQAARRENSYNFENQSYEGYVTDQDGNQVKIENRSNFVFREIVPVYPDTLVWVRDFSYSYNEPQATNYFWHPAFDDYPLVGVNWLQAKAFCHWRTKLQNDFMTDRGAISSPDYRLPTEVEWEYAARAGRHLSMYPWGGYYPREQDGVFISNFKPLRGNYVEDGGITTTRVGSYDPNDYGLFDMSGNVAEWTNDAFDEAAYFYTNDLNPSVEYDALPDDPKVMKRKVIRGGSWKDNSGFLQVSKRSYEYQDTAKSFVGFRCVRSSFCEDYNSPSAPNLSY